MTAPPLETPRLLLDAHTLADFEPMAAMWADPVVNRHIGPPATRYETWKRLLRYRGYWPLLGYGSWAVREKATSRFIGDAGFRGLWQAGHIATDGAVEAGWVLAAWARTARASAARHSPPSSPGSTPSPALRAPSA